MSTATFFRRDESGTIVEQVNVPLADLDTITPAHPIFAGVSREKAAVIIDHARRGVNVETPDDDMTPAAFLALRGIRVEDPAGGVVHADGRVTFTRCGPVHMPGGLTLGLGSVCHDVTIRPDGGVSIGRTVGRGYRSTPSRTLTVLVGTAIPPGHPLLAMVTRRKLAADLAALPDGATVATDSEEVLAALHATGRVLIFRTGPGDLDGPRWERLREMTGLDGRGPADDLHPSLDGAP